MKQRMHPATEIISFAEDTASKLNITDRTVRQEIYIAEHLTPEVKMPVTGMTVTACLEAIERKTNKQDIWKRRPEGALCPKG